MGDEKYDKKIKSAHVLKNCVPNCNKDITGPNFEQTHGVIQYR